MCICVNFFLGNRTSNLTGLSGGLGGGLAGSHHYVLLYIQAILQTRWSDRTDWRSWNVNRRFENNIPAYLYTNHLYAVFILDLVLLVRMYFFVVFGVC